MVGWTEKPTQSQRKTITGTYFTHNYSRFVANQQQYCLPR